MTAISVDEQHDRDWDWYAVDHAGMIGHFTTAGIRALPKTVQCDRDATLSLIHYFDVEAPKSSPYVVRAGVETDAGGWKTNSDREQHLSSFVGMAAAGLFSYDTFTYGPDKYYLVALPSKPLHIDELPQEVSRLLARTRSTLQFQETIYIAEVDTLDW
jgi:hypothetical protein